MTLPAALPPLAAIEAELARRARRQIDKYFPDAGPLRRELYAKHIEFFRAGATHRERCFMAGNRTGKTQAGVYEMTLHLTGIYPDWWEGRRFDKPVKAWAAGDTSKTVRDILQEKFLGPPGARGTGMIPGDRILKVTTKSGVADAADTAYVRHAAGGASALGFKSYDQRRESFQGCSQDAILLDEEPEMAIYAESLMRTMTTGGLMMLTFTPLNGLTDVALSFLGDGKVEQPSV